MPVTERRGHDKPIAESIRDPRQTIDARGDSCADRSFSGADRPRPNHWSWSGRSRGQGGRRGSAAPPSCRSTPSPAGRDRPPHPPRMNTAPRTPTARPSVTGSMLLAPPDRQRRPGPHDDRAQARVGIVRERASLPPKHPPVGPGGAGGGNLSTDLRLRIEQAPGGWRLPNQLRLVHPH